MVLILPVADFPSGALCRVGESGYRPDLVRRVRRIALSDKEDRVRMVHEITSIMYSKYLNLVPGGGLEPRRSLQESQRVRKRRHFLPLTYPLPDSILKPHSYLSGSG